MIKKANLHIINQVISEIVLIFDKLGFEVALGPELENEYYNFDALNVPKDHSARDMQDTFWIKNPQNFQSSFQKNDKLLLRTHTSPVQIHYMEKHQPPIRIIAPGRVFRNESTDSTHEAQFYQLEGLLIDNQTSMAELKGVLSSFMKEFFGEETEIRFRPSFFPFTEPSVEVDVKRPNGQWLEVLGAGMVHPNVLDGVGINSKKYKGFAFGVGIDRLVMLRYGVDDIRMLYSGDLRFLSQFN